MGRRATTTAGAVALVLAVAGCAGSAEPGAGASTVAASASAAPTDAGMPTDAGLPANIAESVSPGAPDGVETEDVAVVADEEPRMLQVVTVSSSSCPILPTDVRWDADAEVLAIMLTGPDAYADAMCTADLAPTTSVVALPDDAPDAAGITVEISGQTLVVD
ncbi:hypothetical protein [Cellulomonas sp. SLBN-39]|uniref:hypothetical protein n=1 Tax=Cellulomonas sp. SLBN-39 TaxID=2768446 RepID=UPI001153B00A|nr:hypothetical protein [Cellulomonas sp. SLBN-39]TQL01842.1 hypothetical protein FBY24_0902 [Cellulomonas sp. SLBN-39]